MKKLLLFIFFYLSCLPVLGEEFLYCDITYDDNSKSNITFKIDVINSQIFCEGRLMDSYFGDDEIKIISTSEYSYTQYVINRYTGVLTGEFNINIDNFKRAFSISGICTMQNRRF